ncbi:MAG TPA: calcium/proton exchanger [Actinomycetota bacterium]|nr:calcium/proton exchanger [Actinomycetota bacterium]
MRWYYWGILGVPVSIAGRVMGLDILTFVAAIVAIIPLAGIIGRATEDLAIHTGPRVGGLLNATFGNVTELVIATFLIIAGESEIVKLSITGSIIGNSLLVLGAALFLGGIKHREQEFNSKVAGMHSASLVLAVTGLMMPALFHQAAPRAGFGKEEAVSIGVASILMILYVSSLIFSFKTNQEVSIAHAPHGEKAEWSKKFGVLVLVGATVLVALESEVLVHSLEGATERLHLSKLWVGLILVPIVGNAAEHSSAIFLAMKNKMDTAIEIAVGSSTQIALFIAPLLIFISLIAGKPMNFFFSGFEIAAVGFSTAIVALISLDGRSNWLEGAQLLAAYLIMGISFYFL